MKKHIILDIVSMWIIESAALFSSFDFTKEGICVVDISMLGLSLFFGMIFAFRSMKWIRIGIDVLKKKPKTILTKGWRFHSRENIYFFDVKKNIYHSIIEFTDPRLPGKYIYLDNRIFKSGDQLKITYYPRSKYIKAIEKVEEIESNCPK